MGVTELFACPVTGEPLRSRRALRYPALEGVPVLVPDPDAFLARHVHPLNPAELPEILPVDAPDLISPFLPAAALEAPGALGAWLAGLGAGPLDVAAGWGAALALPGPALDGGCGVGAMAYRMVGQGRPVYAVDRSPRAVLLARDLLTGRLREAPWPTWRGGCELRAVPVAPIAEGEVRFAIADLGAPPLRTGSFAWIHLGNVLDVASAGSDAVLAAVAERLAPGGLLTITTPHDLDLPATRGGRDPAATLVEALDDLGLAIEAEEDAVPWVIRQYDRGFRVLLAHCLAARRA